VWCGSLRCDVGVHQTGVEKSDIQAFCAALDWRNLGSAALDEKLKLRIAPLHLFRNFLNSEGINQRMAKEFINGIGWKNLKTGMTDYFNPDGLAALRIFLTNKCKYNSNELRKKGLQWESKTTWFQAFTNIPCSVDESNLFLVKPYLKYARHGLLCEDISPLLESDNMDLRAWQIFIYNMNHAEPNYISSTVIPILKNFSKDRFENLFSQADLKSIGIFFNHFNPKDGIFDWSLPSDIDYRKIDFLQSLPGTSLIELAHFVFNFYFIKAAKWSHFFAEELDENFSQLFLG